jgi:hypothetical protein
MATKMRARPGGIRAASARWGGWRALGGRDPGGTSLRRALRVAIVVPPMAAFAGTIVGDPAAVFAVFGAFALLGLADFGGPTIPRARAYAGATAVGAGLVLLGTLASATAWSAVGGGDARRRRRVLASLARSPGLATRPDRDRPGDGLVLERGDRPARRRAGPTAGRRGRRRPIPLVAMTTPPPAPVS